MTAYAVPTIWGHGDYPIAADLNKISSGQKNVHETRPAGAFHPCVKQISSGERLAFWHRHRWLHYKSTGSIIDPAGIEETVSLPNPSDDWVNVYDLDSVAWLSYGALYYVEGVDFAAEQESS